MTRKYVLLGVLIFAFLAMGLFAHHMWRLVDKKTDHRHELAVGNWVFSENLHFFNLNRNYVNIYSKNLPAKTLYFGDVQLNVVPLFLEPGRQPASGDSLIFVNDLILLRFACFLSTTDRNHVLANAILHFLSENDSYVSKRYSYVISACEAILNGNSTYEEWVSYHAKSYTQSLDFYGDHFVYEQPTWLQCKKPQGQPESTNETRQE